MSQRLRIDRIDLRLRGVSPDRAREIAARLGQSLQPSLERELGDRRQVGSGPARVQRVQAPTVRAVAGASATQTATTVARAVVDALPHGSPGGVR